MWPERRVGKSHGLWGVVMHAFKTSTWGQSQVDWYEFESRLVCRVTSGPARLI